jgi:hypothetical protein
MKNMKQFKKMKKIVKWYPVAKKLMIQLMTDENPCEFITELLLPFTIEAIRGSEDPWKSVQKIAPNKYID